MRERGVGPSVCSMWINSAGEGRREISEEEETRTSLYSTSAQRSVTSSPSSICNKTILTEWMSL
jgi:hypothetical protein